MRVVLAVAVLLVTAGCVGFAPSSDLQAPEPAEGDPPGVDESGVQNASRLVDAHVDALAGESYAFEFERSSTDVEDDPRQVLNHSMRVTGRSNGTAVLTRANKTATDVNGTVVLQRFGLRTQADTATSTTWSMGDTHVQRFTEGDDHHYYEQFSERPKYDGLAPRLASIQELLREYEFAVTDRTVRGGETFVVLEPEPSTTDADETVTVDGRLVVDLSGRIHSVEFSATHSRDYSRETQSVSYSLTLRDVGKLPAPSWTDDAQRALDASLDVEDTFDNEDLRVDHHDGDPLPAGSTLVVEHGDETYRLTLDEQFEPGESRFITFPENETAAILSTEEPPLDYPQLSGVYKVYAFGPDGLPAEDGVIRFNASLGP
jgi:hypothetical protein